ncbi:MAG: hypothetical protein IT443_02110 [Phycisphaeraceae bacterium]|nr:hypothetical protein [Phycisphaeraceae bacterium]
MILGRLHIFAGLCALAIALPSAAQSAQAIDQTVEDQGTTSTSLRHVEFGLRQTGQQSSLLAVPNQPDIFGGLQPVDLYRSNALPDHTFYRVGPGYLLRVQKMDYLVRDSQNKVYLNRKPRVDGEFREMPGPNAYFELSPWLAQSLPNAAAGMNQPHVPLAAVPAAQVPWQPPQQAMDFQVDLANPHLTETETAHWKALSPRSHPPTTATVDPQTGRIDTRINTSLDGRAR